VIGYPSLSEAGRANNFTKFRWGIGRVDHRLAGSLTVLALRYAQPVAPPRKGASDTQLFTPPLSHGDTLESCPGRSAGKVPHWSGAWETRTPVTPSSEARPSSPVMSANASRPTSRRGGPGGNGSAGRSSVPSHHYAQRQSLRPRCAEVGCTRRRANWNDPLRPCLVRSRGAYGQSNLPLTPAAFQWRKRLRHDAAYRCSELSPDPSQGVSGLRGP
jgi:hypothetical protein